MGNYRFWLIFSLLIGIYSLLFAGTAHGVYLEVVTLAEEHPSQATFNAWIVGREDEVLNENSAGCQYIGEGTYMGTVGLQCGSFPTQWEGGDILHIEAFTDYGNGTKEIVLEPGDYQLIGMIYGTLCPRRGLILSFLTNGSFEDGSEQSLAGWVTTDSTAVGFSSDKPDFNFNDWSIKVASSNTQGNPNIMFYQLLPFIENGDIWKLKVWAKTDDISSNPKIEILKINQEGSYEIINSVQIESQNWQEYSIQSTINFEPNQDLAVNLNSGLVGGPIENYTYFDLVRFEKIEGESNNNDDELQAHSYRLSNYPNPFNPTTTISYELPRNAKDAKIEIYNLKGQKIRTFPINRLTDSSIQQIVWNGKDENDKAVSSGIYLYRLNVSSKIISSKKGLLLK